MKRTLNKNIRREFKFSIARFLSLATLIALGVFVLIGLKVTGSDMRKTANTYYEKHQMADAKIEGNIGFTQQNQRYIKNLAHVKKVEFSNYADAVLKGTQRSIRVESLTKNLSTVNIVKGRTAKNSHEIVLNQADENKYHLGDTITLVNNQGDNSISGLKHSHLKVVGFGTSSDYLKKDNLGTTNAGTGQLATFGFTTKSAFSNSPTVARLSYNNVSGASYSNEYEKQVEQNVEDSQAGLRTQAKDHQNRLKRTATDKLDQKATQLKLQQTKLERAQKKLKSQQAKLNAAKSMLSATQIKPQVAQLRQADKKIQVQQAKLTSAKSTLQQKYQEIKRLPTITYEIQSRNDYNEGYNQFGGDAKRIDVLSNTFPIIFFAVAILVCLTTMFRMAEEKRIELGTLRAFGYTKLDTMKVFLVYGTLAGLLGSIIGGWLGTHFLPTKIFATYAANFTIPNFQTPISPFWISISIVISLLCTTLPAVWVASRSLQEMPGTLMLPKPPKAGARVLLEHVPFIWNRLNFNYKVMIRNLVRYKGRMLMTILGVLGCTTLLITGFGIRDSLNGIVKKQYQELVHYDVIGVYNPNATKAKREAYQHKVENLRELKSSTDLYYESVTNQPKGYIDNQPIALMVPKDANGFKKFVTLENSVNEKKLNFSDSGAIITQKLATINNVTVGDHLTISDTVGHHYRITISGITKMYAGHSIYMNPTYYHKVFDKKVSYNAKMIMLKNRSKKSLKNTAMELAKQSAAVTAIQSNDAKTTINNMLSGLNNLVMIIIIAASALAFVVLFTLTNINVSERIRELSTIKVLGFYPKEVVLYIYRETFVLTIVGILIGFAGGVGLHNYIMGTLPPENTMADMTVFWTNFVTSGGMTLFFSIIVMILMAQKINRIDMLEALKSVD